MSVTHRSLRGKRIRHLSWAALTAAVMTLTACGGSLSSDSSGGSSSGPVKIGFSVPQSGVYAALGDEMTKGFELYLEQNDGKLGGHEIEVVRADEGETPQTGVPATSKLLLQDKVSAVVGITNSATALALKETFTQSKVPLIIANAGADTLLDDGTDYVWRTSFDNGDLGASLGPEVAKDVGDGTVYLMAPDYAAGHELVGSFEETFTAAGGKVAGKSYTPLGTTTDWQPYLNKVRESGASAVYVFYGGAEAVKFAKQYDTFGFSGDLPLYAPGFLTEGAALAAQGDAVKGVRTSLHYSDLLENDVNQEFVTAYSKKYDMAPTVFAVQAYDAAAVLDQALESAESTDGQGIVDALKDVGDIDSPRGTWRFDENHDIDQTYYLREVQDTPDGLGNVVLGELS